MLSIRRKIAVASAILPLFAMAIPNHMDLTGDWHISPRFGVYRPSLARDMRARAMVGLGLGYNITNEFSAELSGVYFRPKTRSTQKKHSSYYINVDGLYAPDFHSVISPYVALGMGDLRIDNTRFAMDAGAGVRLFALEEAPASISLSYRFIYSFANNYKDNMVYAAATYYWGGMAERAGSLSREARAEQFQKRSKYALPKGFPPCKDSNDTGCLTLTGNDLSMRLDVKFADNRAQITKAYEPQLKHLGKFLQKYPGISLSINGYTSHTGHYQHNQSLSERRANRVKQFLVNNYGIDPDRLNTEGWSWVKPVASNKTKAGQAANRRVEAEATVPLKG